MTESIEILKEKQIGLLRADSGFYGQKFFEFLEKRQINYIIACKNVFDIKNADKGLKELDNGRQRDSDNRI